MLGFLLCLSVVMERAQDEGEWGGGRKEGKFAPCVFSSEEIELWDLLDNVMAVAQRLSLWEQECYRKCWKRVWYHLFARSHLPFKNKAKMSLPYWWQGAGWYVILGRIWNRDPKENGYLMRYANDFPWSIFFPVNNKQKTCTSFPVLKNIMSICLLK